MPQHFASKIAYAAAGEAISFIRSLTMSQKLTMTLFREFFQNKVKNIEWPSFNMMKSSGRIVVDIAEPLSYGATDEPYHGMFTISYDTKTKYAKVVGEMSDLPDSPKNLDTVEDLDNFYTEFYNKLKSRVVSVNCHLEMDTYCMHGVEKDYT
jgi:hypothetical protein